MRPNRLASLAALALAGGLLVACSDDDDEGGTATQTTVTTAPPAVTADTTTTTGQRVTTTVRAGGVATTARAAATLDCQTVAFTPNSEDAASSIKATGLSCAEAEAFVRIAGGRTSSGGPARLDVEGYSCVRVRSVQDPLPQAFYECTSGSKKVTFVRS